MLHNHCPACAEICHSHVHTVQPFKNNDAQITESCFAPKIVHFYTALNYFLTVLRETPVCMDISTRFISSNIIIVDCAQHMNINQTEGNIP